MAKACQLLSAAFSIALLCNSTTHAQQQADPPDRQAAALRFLNATNFMDRRQRVEDAVAGNEMIGFLAACTKKPPTYPWREQQCIDPMKTWKRVNDLLTINRTKRLAALQTLAIHLYAISYTTDELNEASGFYEGAVGRKIISDDAQIGPQFRMEEQLSLMSALSDAEQVVIGGDVGPAK